MIECSKAILQNEIFIQTLGLIGMAIQMFSMQTGVYKRVIFMTVAGELVFGVQLLLLGALTGAATNFAACITNIVYYLRIKKQNSTLPFQIAFCVLFVTVGIMTWQGPVSLLVILAKLISTVSYGIEDTKIIRRLKLISMPMWLIYDCIFFSIGGVLTDIILITSTIIGIIRFDIKKKETHK